MTLNQRNRDTVDSVDWRDYLFIFFVMLSSFSTPF